MKRLSLQTIVHLLFLFATITVPVRAQDSAQRGTVGLSCSLQRDQFDIMVPVAVSPGISFAPSIGIASVQDAGTDLHVGITAKGYITKDQAAPFIGVRTALLSFSPKGGTPTSDWLFGGIVGGEYFFNAHLSVGIEAQLNFTVSDDTSTRFGNPGKSNFNTGTAMFASIYF